MAQHVLFDQVTDFRVATELSPDLGGHVGVIGVVALAVFIDGPTERLAAVVPQLVRADELEVRCELRTDPVSVLLEPCGQTPRHVRVRVHEVPEPGGNELAVFPVTDPSGLEASLHGLLQLFK